MGKPFAQELKGLRETFLWAFDQKVDIIESLKKDEHTPVLVVGSGGSLSACFIAVSLLQKIGIFAKAVTPLELQYQKQTLSHSRLVFISAGGKNTDILYAYKTAIEANPVSLTTICMRVNTPLSKLSRKYSTSNALEYTIPAGKDGFLATNSLVAYFTLFIRAFHNKKLDAKDLDFTQSDKIVEFAKSTTPETTICVLYAGWSHAVAIDIESKFTEAALGNVHISDYRNFAHGRHHWFAKRSNQSAMVALVTPDDEFLASKTLQLLPVSVPKLILKSKEKTPLASLELLIKSFRLVQLIGEQRNFDPGRPGVPSFGRKIYNLKYASLLSSGNQKAPHSKLSLQPILKKAKISNIDALTQDQYLYWTRAYTSFTSSLKKAKFGAVVFDYDGTLCRPQDRFNPLSRDVKSKLNEILREGFVVGIVTGRGQSVRKELQDAIDEIFWKNVIVGYYNGADIGLLGNNGLPIKNVEADPDLKTLYHLIKDYDFPFEVKAELRPRQLTIEINDTLLWQRIRSLLLQIIMKSNAANFQVLESSHSMDIIKRPDVSKLNIISHCMEKNTDLRLGSACLCIGDRGEWPGNDFELLATPYSLSVDEVSLEKNCCWNLSPVGIKGVEATLLYLEQIKFSKNHFTFRV